MYRIILFILLSYHIVTIATLAPCDPTDIPDVCGILPSTYADLSLPPGPPPFCNFDCTLPGGFDRCRVCGGPAAWTQGFHPSVTAPHVSLLARLGSSIANWNGSFAMAQHIAADYAPVVTAPVVTFTLNHTTGLYTEYQLPLSPDGVTNVGYIVPSRGYGLCQSENYLAVGTHDSNPRIVQLWVRTTTPPWTWWWTATDPCPGNYFGFAAAIDERIPHGPGDGIFGSVIFTDPRAQLAGRAYVYTTYSGDILQELCPDTACTDTTLVCYGDSVSADSGYLAVGAPSTDYALQSAAGMVYIYVWDPSLGIQGEYDAVNFFTIPPPIPMVNGGFGESVSVWDNYVMIGDNMHNTYLYRILGLSAIPVLFDQPTGMNQLSRLGYAVSIWEELAVAGDEEYIPVPSSRGAAFVWTPNPLVPTSYRPTYFLQSDLIAQVNTHYGADVDARGGCLVAIGAPGYVSSGGAFVVNLCDIDCYGCDDVLNSCIVDDACGVCNGDNTTCIGCDGIIDSGLIYDLCGVCGGNSTTCVSITSPTSFVIPCNGTFTTNVTAFIGTVQIINITVPPAKGDISWINGFTLTYVNTPFFSGIDTFSITVKANGLYTVVVYTVNMGTCPDCIGVLGGTHVPDVCGVCNGNGSTCADCFGIPNGPAVYDDCGVCGGTDTTCVIIPNNVFNGTCTAQIIQALDHIPSSLPVKWSIFSQPTNGSVVINAYTGVFTYINPGVGGTITFQVRADAQIFPFLVGIETITLYIDNTTCIDCNGINGGLQLLDLCGVCGGDSTSCADCARIPYGNHTLSICSICYLPPAIPNDICIDCLGVPYGTTRKDVCGVCGGDGSTCMGGSSLDLPLIIFIIIFLTIALRMGWQVWIEMQIYRSRPRRSNFTNSGML